MKILFILNEAPYGSENVYNALRLAMKLQQEHAEAEVRVFLMADAVNAALPGQTTPQGYYNIERMLKAIIHKQGQIKACGTCVEARGLDKLALIEGIAASTMSQLAQWVMDSDKVLTF
ncbi:MAG: DsrE family protein [Nitrospira sp.]|nr:DsrE family protein [Nitrospira sp.]